MQGEKQGERKNRVKENRGQQLQFSCALLEHFPNSIFYILYTISKLRKSRIQCFKRCMIRSWNEEVTAISSRSLQSVAKSAFCCGMISQHFCTVLWISPEVSCRDGSQTPQDESQLRSAAESAFCCKVISQLFLFVCEISQPFCAPAKFSWVLPVICDRRFLIFHFRYLLSKSQFSPCNPPIRWFLRC